MKPTLLIMAAGMGSRYGGLKQLDKLGPSGETIMEYSMYDAIQAGFGKVVFVVRDSFFKEFKTLIEKKITGKIETAYVTQELEKIPQKIEMHPEREKPWGTGHAVWVARNIVKTPFAVINADDFYGKEAFVKMAGFLSNGCDENTCSLMGYKLSKTVSQHGSVARGICKADENQNLEKIDERTNIITDGSKISWLDTKNNWHELSPDTLVSMNFWGFSTNIFTEIAELLKEFLRKRSKELKSEFFIPEAVDRLIQKKKIMAKVLPTKAKWFGVTYREDRNKVVQNIRQLVDEGIYPGKLWD